MVIEAAWLHVVIYILKYTITVRCEYAYITADLFHPTFNISGRMPITVLAQSTSVNITINGSGEVYTCTLNNQTMDITSGQPAAQQTGLTPNTSYTVNCHSVNGRCREATEAFTTGTV